MYRLLLLLLLSFISCKSLYLADQEVVNIRVADSADVADVDVDKIIAPYRVEMEEKMNEVIGELSVELRKERPESNIGNWLSDMMLVEAQKLTDLNVDFASQNQGGIRVSSVAAGDLTVGEVFEVMPFDNTLVILKADSAGVHQFLNHIAGSRGWPISQNLRFQIKDKAAVNIEVANEPLRSGRQYNFAIPDYIANGGSNSHFLKEYDRIETGVLLRDLFVKNIRASTDKGEMQSPVKDGRITIIQE